MPNQIMKISEQQTILDISAIGCLYKVQEQLLTGKKYLKISIILCHKILLFIHLFHLQYIMLVKTDLMAHTEGDGGRSQATVELNTNRFPNSNNSPILWLPKIEEFLLLIVNLLLDLSVCMTQMLFCCMPKYKKRHSSPHAIQNICTGLNF